MKPDGRLALAMRREILQCLRETQQIDGAARLLGLGRQTLYNRVKSLGIIPSDWRDVAPESDGPPPAQPPPLLLKELADLLARYSVAVVAVAPPLDALVLGEFHVPANGVPPVADAVKRRLINRPNSFNGSSRCREALISPLSTLQLSTLHPSTLNRSPRTIDLFLRLGIDLRRKNMAQRRYGFWRRFEGELDYLLSDARAAYLDKIKLAHPDRGGDPEAATNLGLAWSILRRRFAMRGVRL